MRDRLPLDPHDLVDWWLGHPEGSRLYHPQGYEGLTSDNRVVEMYLNAVIDHDLEIHYCISVRWRPYLAGWTLNGSVPVDRDLEVRDHLFVSVELLKRHPDLVKRNWHGAWMGWPYQPFDEDSPSQRDIMSRFMDFIEAGDTYG